MAQRGRKSAAALTVVAPTVDEIPWSPAEPPRPLGKHGRALWNSVVASFEIEGAGNVEQLAQACSALDRAEACRCQIDRDGELIETASGAKEHPLLKHELACRAFLTRTVQRLGLEG